MKNKSAGLLMFRFKGEVLELLLCHMGGPFWKKKDSGSWTIPKGECEEGEDPIDTAKREFFEETGFIPEGTFIELTTLKQPGGKQVSAWAFESDCDVSKIKSNTFELEWPPHSGKISTFPEIDRAEWFTIKPAREKILKGQVGFIEELCAILKKF
jgi:predicted NUDIX family NTP pyrophosphohydrolase